MNNILKIAVPSIIANITTPLLGMIDMAIVGHMGDTVYIAAISLGGIIFSMIYWVFGFLRMGTSGLTAQAIGRNDASGSNTVLMQAISLAFALGIVFIILQAPIRDLMLRFLGADTYTNRLAAEYFNILIYGAPATLLTYSFNGWFIGNQNSKATMWISLTINIANIIASLILVYALRMGIAGVATGSLIAQWSGVAMALFLSLRYGASYKFSIIIMRGEQLSRFFNVNRDIFLRTLCLVAVTVWFTRAGARQGDVILSVNALLMQLFLMFSYIMDGFAFAGEALAGKLAGEMQTADKCGLKSLMIKRNALLKSLFLHGVVIAIAFTIIYFAGGETLLSLLSDDPDVAAASADYRYWAATVPLAGFGAFIWDGIFIGETRTRGMLISIAAAMIVYFIVYFSLISYMGNHALWLAFVLYLSVRAIVQSILYFRK